MKNELFSFAKPEGWNIIKKERYKDFSIVENPNAPCEYGFAVGNEIGGFDVVSVYNYGHVGSEFLEELKSQLDVLKEDNTKVQEVNDYIEENAQGFAVNKTDYIKPVYYKKGSLYGHKVFINIMEIKTNVTIAYSLQIFTLLKDTMFCFTTSALALDNQKPFESLMEKNKHVDQLVNSLIKSIE